MKAQIQITLTGSFNKEAIDKVTQENLETLMAILNDDQPNNIEGPKQLND